MPSYNLGTAEGRIVIDGSGAEKGFSVARAAAEGFAGVVQSKVAQVEQMGQRLVAVGTAGVAGFGVAVTAAANFEQGLSAVAAVSGATAEEMELISDKALQIGKDTSFGATEAASAIEELVKAGVSVEDVLNGAADATVALAAAGSISLPEAATISANAMNQFQLSAEELPRVADLIAGAANASAIDVSQFGQSLSQVGAVANLTGLSFDDTAVAIAQLGNAGIVGSDAGTSLKTMFMNLIPTTNDQIKEFERLGLMTNNTSAALTAMAEQGIAPVGESYEEIRQAVSSYLATAEGIPDNTAEMGAAVDDWLRQNGGMQNAFFDTEGKIKSLAEIQGILATATGDMSEQQKLASLELLFGSDAIRGAAVLAGEGAAGFNEMATAMGRVSAEEVAETRLDNLAGSMEKLKGSIETALITIGQVVLPVVRKVVDALVWLVDVFNNLPGPVKQAIGVLFAIATVFSLIMGALTLLLVALPAILGKFLLFRTIGAATRGLMAFVTVLRAGGGIAAAASAGIGPLKTLGTTVMRVGRIALAAGKLMRAAWVMATGPIGLIVIAVAALVAAFIWAYNNIEGFRNLVDSVVRSVVQFFQNLWDKILAAGPAVANFFTKTIPDAITKAWDAIKGWGENVLQFFRDLPGNIGQFLTNLGSSIAEGASTAFNWLVTKAQEALAAVGQFFMDLPGNVAYALGWLAGTIARGAVTAFNWIVDTAVSAFNATMTFFEELPGKLASFFTGLASDIAAWAATTWKSITDTASTALDNTVAWFAALPGRIAVFFVTLAADVAAWGTKTWTGFLTNIETAWAGVMAWFAALPARLLMFGLSIVEWFKKTGTDTATGFGNSIQSGFNGLIEWFTTLPARFVEWVSGIGTWLMQAGTDLINGLKNGISAAWDALWGWVTGLWDSFIQGFKDSFGIASPSTVFLQFGRWILEGLLNGLLAVVQSIYNFFATAISNIINNWSAAGSWLWNAGSNIISGLRNGVSSAWSGFWGWISGFGSSIIDLFGGAASWLWNAGQNVVRGLWNGISNMAGWLWNRISNWAGNIVDNVLGALGINSPSIHMIYAGEMLAKGLSKGVDDNTDDAVRATTRMAEAIQDGWDAALPDLTAMVEAQAGLDVTTTSAMSASMAGATTGMLAATNGNPVVPASDEVNAAAAAAQVKYEFNTYNPVAEKASDSEARAIRATSAMGGLG